jgi:DNA modification methylase
MTPTKLLGELREKAKLTESQLARLLGTSLVSIYRWERGVGSPSPAQIKRIFYLHRALRRGELSEIHKDVEVFPSRGVRTRANGQGVLGEPIASVHLSEDLQPPVLTRLMTGRVFDQRGEDFFREFLDIRLKAARTRKAPLGVHISGGKNTYTYDAHTYHTKVPPQAIAEVLRYYLPEGGLVFDPFAGSGMTGVAALTLGFDCILNELSPAACFIANRFTSAIRPGDFEAAVHAIMKELSLLRKQLYSTQCRECRRETELLYVVWSYRVVCSECAHEFQLWDVCRKYGRRVREHKILTEFPCPSCKKHLQKSVLKRTFAEPVMVGYKCCGSKQQEVTREPSKEDLELIAHLESYPPLAEGFFPQTKLPDGVNLRQPVKHGLNRIDRFYTPRNLAALSHLWKTIHRIESAEIAGHLAFVFTSLYKRVTKLSEFRFWGGSGNTAHFNVPFIFNEPNVFIAFEQKARTIQDHLEATAITYKGRVVVTQNSATSLDYLPSDSVDLIFTDPPFGGNINYSEMNFLWESWLGRFTQKAEEAIVNRVQGKGIREYELLMRKSLGECFRVLRGGHWMILVFMNSSKAVWEAIRNSITSAGFQIKKIQLLDKQHGTFKQFVSENTAGMDLVLHCLKPGGEQSVAEEEQAEQLKSDVISFLSSRRGSLPTNYYVHVGRQEEIDFRMLYSEWLAQSLMRAQELLDFQSFRRIVLAWITGDRANEKA